MKIFIRKQEDYYILTNRKNQTLNILDITTAYGVDPKELIKFLNSKVNDCYSEFKNYFIILNSEKDAKDTVEWIELYIIANKLKG